MSGAHFHGVPPHSSTEAHASHGVAVEVLSGTQALVAASQWKSGSHPAVVQSSVAGHSSPTQGRHAWFSHTSLASQSDGPPQPVVPVLQMPCWQVSPIGH